MGQPPWIDEHVREVPASIDQTWSALLAVLGRLGTHLPRGLAAAWGLEPRARQGDWPTQVTAGDTIPGFSVATSDPPRLLVLQGGHRFSTYELHFQLERRSELITALAAQTFADFPGIHGLVYRTLVIASGGHRLAVRRMLGQVAHRAER